MADVKIGAKYLVADYDLVFQDIKISPPAIKETVLELQGTSRIIDLTEAISGDVEFKRRTITITAQAINGVRHWANKYSELVNDIHGRNLQIIATNDPTFYWIGRLDVKRFDPKPSGADIVITAVVDPYKYEVASSLEPSEWEEMSLDAIIREYYDLPVNPSYTLEIIGRRKKVCPTFITTQLMSVTYLGNTYTLINGSSQVPDIFLGEGTHVLTFNCLTSAFVSVDYRGAML